MTTLTLRLNDQEESIEATQQGDTLHITIGDEMVELIILHADPPYYILEQQLPDGQRKQFKVAGAVLGDNRQLWCNGRMLAYERIRRRGRGNADAGSLAATIPAVVSQLLVGVGDSVSAGDKLILLESMKMVIPIQAPYDGVVKAINCTVGDSVQPGHPLVELEKV